MWSSLVSLFKKPFEAAATIVATVLINKLVEWFRFWKREREQLKKEQVAIENYKKSAALSTEEQEKAFQDLLRSLKRDNNS